VSGVPNPARGEAAFLIDGMAHVVRPTFAALVAAEAELGPLLALAERAAEGRLTFAEMAALIWHCMAERPADLTREMVGDAMLAQGVGVALPPLRAILKQVLAGSS